MVCKCSLRLEVSTPPTSHRRHILPVARSVLRRNHTSAFANSYTPILAPSAGAPSSLRAPSSIQQPTGPSYSNKSVGTPGAVSARNALRDLSLKSGEVWYFAYGSNMNPSTMRMRLVWPRISAPCEVPDYELTFNHLGLPYVEPGFASIERKSNLRLQSTAVPGGVHGVLHAITAAEWVQVLRTEGGYDAIEVDCSLYSGQRVRAMTLTSRRSSSHGSRGSVVSPSARYLNLLIEGAVHHGVDPAYVAQLKAITPYTPTSLTQFAMGSALVAGTVVPTALAAMVPTLLSTPKQLRAPGDPSDDDNNNWANLAAGKIYSVAAGTTWFLHDHFWQPVLGSGSGRKPSAR